MKIVGHDNYEKGEIALTFIVKTIDAIDRGALVVSSEDEKVLGIFDLERQLRWLWTNSMPG